MKSTTEANLQSKPGEQNSLPPVVLLGGEANALSVARSLHRLGAKIYAIGESDSSVRYSRICQWIPVAAGSSTLENAWANFLLSTESDFLRGAVVLACSDAGIRVLAQNRDALLLRFKLDDSNPTAQIAMLDKQTTYQHAVAAGVPTPKFWAVQSREEVLALRDSLVFPLLVKPRMSHLFEKHFGSKFITATSFDQLIKAFDVSSDAGLEVLLMELIPGPDSKLCSYYTYMDATGTPLFDFTKRVIRRYPAGMGTACYHVTDWIPQIIPQSLALLQQVGLQGLANIEFKLDDRDGQYKLIECNGRFTAPNCLVASSGFDLARFVYNRATGRPQAELKTYKKGLRLWSPVQDFACFRSLRRAGELTFRQWIGSVLHRQTFPFFAWTDPMPTLMRACRPLKRLVTRRKPTAGSVTAEPSVAYSA